MSHKAGSSSTAPSPVTSAPVALLASTIAGSVEPLISYPFEFIKTSQQLNSRLDASKLKGASPRGVADATTNTILKSIDPHAGRVGFVSVARHVWQKEGMKGFYHGVGVVSSGGAAKAVVRLSTYSRLKKALQAPDGSLSGSRSLLAGLGAGIAEAFLVVIPTETIKTKIVHSTTLANPPFQSSSTNSYAAFRTLTQNGGLRAIYSGVSATICRQALSSMVRFGTYTSLKNLVQGSARPGQKLPSGVTFGIGALAGAATVYGTMPFDVVKTRMQSISARSRYRNTFWCLIHTAQEEGVTALWRGATMRLIRLTVSGAVIFTIYEEVISLAGESA